MRFSPWTTLLVLGLSISSLGPAVAQQPPRKPLAVALSKEAKTAWETGQKLASLGEHEAALRQFQRAHALSSDPRLLLWIGHAERDLGKLARAYSTLGVFLREAAPGPKEKARKEAEDLLAELKPRLGTLLIKSATEGAVVMVDGDVVGRTPMGPLLVERGVRIVRVTKEQHRPFERSDVNVNADLVSLEVELEKEPLPLSEALSGPAKEAYEAGKLLFVDGDYASARVKFRTSYDLSKDARLLWNMAVCEKNLRHYARVLALVEQYLAEGKDVTTSQDRREAEELLKIVRAFITPLQIETSEEGASVFVDDEVVAQTPMAKPVLIDVGSRKIRVVKEGFSEFTTQAAISGADTMTIKAELTPIKHEGKLVITASPRDVISIDGKVVGQGHWEGTLTSGTHAVLVTGKERRPHQTDVAVEDNVTRRIQVTLEAEPTKPMTWLWAGGGVLAAAGLGVGAYFLLRPETTPAPAPVAGTMPPGSVQLPLRPRWGGFWPQGRSAQGTSLQPTFTWRMP